MASAEATLEQRDPLGRKLWWLIFGRLGAAMLLLVASAVWINKTGQQLWSKVLPPLAVVVGLTIIYALAHRFSEARVLQLRIQFALDIFLVTWLVWTSDVINSPYTALYIVIIAVASLFLSRRDVIVLSVGCAVAFTGCAFAAILELAANPVRQTPDNSLARTIQSVGLFDIAFFVVGLLSARLAEQRSRSDVRLIAAAQSLANLRALHERIVESIRSGVITTDLQGRIYTFNAAAAEITGYNKDDVRGQFASILFGEMKTHFSDSIQATNAGETSPRYEADCLTADGMRLRLGFSISPLFAETGETTGMVITFQDLTQIRVLEETSRRQDQLAAIGRMAASIAHEIRNPLAAMRGSIQMLRQEMKSDNSEANLMEIILRESDRLNRIITDFLNYARPRSIVHSQVNIGELLHETFTLLRYSPEINDGQTIEEDLGDRPLMADVDAEQLQQVFWNLARNALQSMPNGGTLRAELASDGNRLRITFSDNGRGMSPNQVEHLFEPFSSTTGGTGLGLSIVYQIIREHGGTINVRSREGEGTKITIELPSQRSEVRGQKSEVRRTQPS